MYVEHTKGLAWNICWTLKYMIKTRRNFQFMCNYFDEIYNSREYAQRQITNSMEQAFLSDWQSPTSQEIRPASYGT
jgi:hypothetical protein